VQQCVSKSEKCSNISLLISKCLLAYDIKVLLWF